MADIIKNPVQLNTHMDLTQPIDITLVQKAVAKHQNVMVALDMLDANEVLRHCTAIPGVTNSIELGRVEGGSISKKYTGVFLGTNNLGKIVPRTLVVRPIVAEMADEPERYRRSWITEVKGGLDLGSHPFEVWLIQHGIDLASKDLLEVLMTAKYVAGTENKEISSAFDGWGSIIATEKEASNISLEKKNLFHLEKLTAVNIGTELLKMWRAMPTTFRRKKSKMWIPDELGDMYDDWLKSETIQLENTDQSGAIYLKGTAKKVELVRNAAAPEGSQMVLLTTKENMVYGYDKDSDMTNMKPFPSGNPYLFTATMKYVFGCQFISLDHSEFCVSDGELAPVVLAASEQPSGENV